MLSRKALTLLLLSPCAFGQSSWTQLGPATSPSPRGGMNGVSDGSHLLVFGGNLGSNVFTDELWSFDGTNWTLLASGAGSPSPRHWGANSYDMARGRMVVFGGDDAGTVGLGDTWEWDGTSWSQRMPATSPSPRRWVHMAYDELRQVTVLFGGEDVAGTYFDDTWEWDGTNWTQRMPATVPPARGRHHMVYDSDRQAILMFGGTPLNGSTFHPDTWIYDGNDWTQLATTPAPFGTGLQQGAAAYDPLRQRTVMQGGQNTSGRSKTWELDGLTWIDRGNFLPGLTARTGQSMAFVPALGKTILFGGYLTGPGGFTNETWAWQTNALATFQTIGTACAGSAGLPTFTSTALPWIDTSFELVVRNVRDATPAFVFFGVSNTISPTFGLLPFDLTPFGAPGCALQSSEEYVQNTFTSQNEIRLPITLPNQAIFLGATIYHQAMIFDTGINPLNLVFSDVGVSTIGAK